MSTYFERRLAESGPIKAEVAWNRPGPAGVRGEIALASDGGVDLIYDYESYDGSWRCTIVDADVNGVVLVGDVEGSAQVYAPFHSLAEITMR